MAIYAISGVILIFRDGTYFKIDYQSKVLLEPNLQEEELGPLLRIGEIRIEKVEGDLMYFKTGTYNKETGEANFTKKQLPFVLDKLTHLHKAKTGDPHIG